MWAYAYHPTCSSLFIGPPLAKTRSTTVPSCIVDLCTGFGGKYCTTSVGNGSFVMRLQEKFSLSVSPGVLISKCPFLKCVERTRRLGIRLGSFVTAGCS